MISYGTGSSTVFRVHEPPQIDYRGTIPPHQQIAAWLRDRIAAGDLRPGQVIPSEKELMQLFGVARTTVRRSVAVLREEGILETIPQRGSYVAKR